jgi:nucleotide-binding universal stress UspA family protein
MKVHDETETEWQPSQCEPGIAVVQSSIVCGTDFSEESARAVDVAAALAKRLGEPFVLVHAVNERRRENLPGDLRDSLALCARAQLHDEWERLRPLQVEAIEAFRAGAPDAVLLDEAAAHHARLLVLGAKRRLLSPRPSGGVLERVAEAGHAPTLVVRDAAPLRRWARQERRLRVLVAADFSAPSVAALRWVDWLRQMGPCDMVVAYIERSIASHPGADSYPALFMDPMALKTERTRERHFQQSVRALLGRSRVRVRIETKWALSDAHLIQLAAEERADLIVLGAHSGRGSHRFGQHSVARGVLRYAPLNVVCVPARSHPEPAPFFPDQ